MKTTKNKAFQNNKIINSPRPLRSSGLFIIKGNHLKTSALMIGLRSDDSLHCSNILIYKILEIVVLMTQESIQPVLNWISSHPHWSGFIVFLISLSESLAIVGLIVPGVVMMTAIGGMMGSGILPAWQTLSWAILGAVAGDGISYWLGYHYHQHLRDFWPFKQFPKLLARGEFFFKHHGGKSIVFGRFVGPVRPMIPVIAGMMDMAPKRFLFFNILSAIAWAPLYSLPGILIGASLGNLSSEVASRAGLLVLLLLLALWCIYEILLLLGAWIVNTLKNCVQFTWEILNRSSLIHSLLKTKQGTEQNQLGILLLFILAVIGFVITTYDALHAEGIAALNEPMYQVLRALYLDKLITTIGLLAGLADPFVLLPAAAMVGFWLLCQKYLKAAGCWLMTIFGGFIAGHYIGSLTAVPRPEGLMYLSHSYSFPSGHTLAIVLTFGLAAAFIQHALLRKYRWLPWVIVIPIILFISCSRIYLGMHWFTDIIGSLTLGIACVALGTFIYRRIVPHRIPMRAILIPGLLTISITFSFYTIYVYPTIRTHLVRAWPIHLLNQTVWWTGKGPTNDLYRTGAFKRQATVFDIQWLGNLNTIQTILEQEGWATLPKLNFKTGVMMLANDPSPTLFPIMPKFHRDRLPVLTVAKPLNAHKRLVLQLWQSDYLSAQTDTPLWVGTLRLEEASHPLPLVTLYLEVPSHGNILKFFTKELNRSNTQVQVHLINAKHAATRAILLLKSQ